MDDPFVSIIIPTYREWNLLQRCLEALSNQTFSLERFEVIIVNNDPSDPVPGFISFPGKFKIIGEGKTGSYAARNTGIKTSIGNIIGFTDSDCIPDQDWIKNAVEYLQSNTTCTRVAGNISIIFKSPNPTVVEQYNQLYAFPQKWLIENGGGSITGNLFTYRHVFETVGGFNENLLSMGDMEWGKRANTYGFNVHFVENVIVKHPSRNLNALIKKEKRHGGGAAKLVVKDAVIKDFIKLIYQFRPRIKAVRFMLSRRKDLRIKDRLFIPLLRYYLLNIRAVEKFKVHRGKAPNRE